jgi:hypothetical protein
VEAPEDGRPDPDAEGRDGRGGEGRADDERAVAPLADPEFVAVNTIIDEDTVRHIIPQLKAAGASGIVEYPLTKIID